MKLKDLVPGVIVIACVAVLIIIGGVYFFVTIKSLTFNQIVTHTSPDLKNDQNTSWQNFTNNLGAFTLKYPPSWKIQNPSANQFNFTDTSFNESKKGMGITIFSNSGYLSAKDYLETYFYSSWVDVTGMSLKVPYLKETTIFPTVVNGYSAEKIDGILTPPGTDGKGIWLHNGDIGILLNEYDSTDPINEENAFNQVLTTFHFTQQLSTENSVDVKEANGDIVVIKDGTEETITSYGHNFNPVLSPDKTKIAYLSYSAESLKAEQSNKGPWMTSTNVWIINLDGTNPVQVTQHVNNIKRANLHWIDNNNLLFSDGEQSVKLYSLSTNSTKTLLGSDNPTFCADVCGYQMSFAFSPSYKYLIRVEASQNPQTKIGIINLTDLSVKQINTPPNILVYSFNFSPDSQILYFQVRPNTSIGGILNQSINLGS